MKVIQICGTNGVGKTTLARKVLTSSPFKRYEVCAAGENKEVWFDGDTAIIGRYGTANCGGVDADGYLTEILLETILRTIREFKPRVLMFEDYRYGSVYNFKRRVHEIARGNGYEYIVFLLVADPKTIVERIIGRSGNENRNFDAKIELQKACIRSAKRIARDGVKVKVIDTGKSTRQEVADALSEVMNG